MSDTPTHAQVIPIHTHTFWLPFKRGPTTLCCHPDAPSFPHNDHAPGTAGLSRQPKAPFLRAAVDISYVTHICRHMVRDRYAKNAGAVSGLKYHACDAPSTDGGDWCRLLIAD
jgi:hypothetical protein